MTSATPAQAQAAIDLGVADLAIQHEATNGTDGTYTDANGVERATLLARLEAIPELVRLITEKRFDNASALMLDEVLSYTSGAGKTVISVDDYVFANASPYKAALAVAADHDVENANGVKFYVVGSRVNLSAFGYDGTAATTARAQAALTWLGRAENRTLVWDIGEAEITGQLTVPNASNWNIEVPQYTDITQTEDDTPAFIMEPSANRYSFGITGKTLRFLWANDQSGTNTKAIGFAVKPTVDMPDGIHTFRFDSLWNENGYDLIGLHPDAPVAKCPCWGFRIGFLAHQTRARGRVFNLNSVVAAGAPAGRIEKIYAKGANSVTDCLVIDAQTHMHVGQLEINDAVGRMVYIESSPNISFGSVRAEKCPLVGGQSIITIAGGNRTIIGSLELQDCDNVGSTGDCFGVAVYGLAELVITGDLIVRQGTGTSGNEFNVFQPQSDGTNFGRVTLPMSIAMQTTDAYVRLYEKTLAQYISFASTVVVGPFRYTGVAAAAYQLGWAEQDGTNTYTELRSPVSGYIVEVVVGLSAAVTSGNIQVRPQKNGVSLGGGAFNAQITSGDGLRYAGIYGYEPPTVNQDHKVAVNDKLRVQFNSSSGVGGGDAEVYLVIAQTNGR